MDIVTLEPAQYDGFFSDWVIQALRSIISLNCFQNDDQWIAEHIVPQVSVERVARAKQYLLSEGFVKQDESGRLYLVSEGITTPAEITHSVRAARGVQRQILSLAEKALDEVDPKDRQIGSVTVSASHQCMMKIKKRVQEFQNEIFEMACADTEASEDVYHLGFQFIPVFRSEEMKSGTQPAST